MKKNNAWGSFERRSATPYGGVRHVWRMHQGGFGTVEYLLITGFLVAALLTPFSVEGDAPQNIVQRLLGAFKSQHRAYLYASRLPVRPHPEGWSGGGPNDSGPGDIFGGGDPGSNGDSGAGSDGNADNPPNDNNSGSNSDGGSDGGTGDESGNGSPNESADEGNSGSNPDGSDGDMGDDSNSGSPDDLADDPDNTADNDNDGSDASDGGDDIPWWLVAAAAEAYCLATPPLDTAWSAEDIDAYEASKAAYQTDGGMLAEIGVYYDQKYRIDEGEEATGFSATLTKVDGQWILAFRGTEIFEGDDWAADAQQALSGSTPQYDQAVFLARQVEKALGGKVLYVGHSLGGGMAAAAAYATGGRAITFNAAGLHSSYRTGDSGEIRAHYVVGELLTTLQKASPLPDAVGTPIAHSASCFSDPFLDVPIFHGPLQRHRLAAFEDSLSRWRAPQESSGDAAATSTRPGEPSISQKASAVSVSSEVDYGLRTFVPPAERGAHPAIQASP